MTKAKSVLVALFLIWLIPHAARSAEFGEETLTIAQKNGEISIFTVELAVDGPQRMQGLMQRQDMAPGRGMLFDFGESRRVTMWMKNTLLPLDMLFIDHTGLIVHLAEDTMPLSESIIDSRLPVRFVLELNAGTAARLGIAIGDRAVSARIAAASAKP